MLVIDLKNYLKNLSDITNVLIFSNFERKTRQLIPTDLTVNNDNNIVINAEYQTPVKKTLIIKKNVTLPC